MSIIIKKKNDSPKYRVGRLLHWANAVILKVDEVVLTNQLRISTNQKTVNYKSRVLHDLDSYNLNQYICVFFHFKFKSHMSSITYLLLKK